MELLKNDRSEIQAASIRLVNALFEAGYISLRDRADISHRIYAGDKTAYSELKDVLVLMANEIGRV